MSQDKNIYALELLSMARSSHVQSDHCGINTLTQHHATESLGQRANLPKYGHLHPMSSTHTTFNSLRCLYYLGHRSQHLNTPTHKFTQASQSLIQVLSIKANFDDKFYFLQKLLMCGCWYCLLIILPFSSM